MVSEDFQNSIEPKIENIEQLNSPLENVKKEPKDGSSRSNITYNINTFIQENKMKGDFISSDGVKNESNDGDINIDGVLKVEQNQWVLSPIAEEDDDIKFMESIFVQNPNYNALKEAISANTVTIVYGEKGIGKYYSSLYALVQLGNINIYKIEQIRFDKDKILSYKFENNKMYIFDNIVSINSNFDRKFIKQLEEYLKPKNVKVIITIESQWFKTLNDLFGKNAFKLDPVMDIRGIIEKHFTLFVKENHQNPENLDKAKQILNEVLGDLSKTLSKNKR